MKATTHAAPRDSNYIRIIESLHLIATNVQRNQWPGRRILCMGEWSQQICINEYSPPTLCSRFSASHRCNCCFCCWHHPLALVGWMNFSARKKTWTRARRKYSDKFAIINLAPTTWERFIPINPILNAPPTRCRISWATYELHESTTDSLWSILCALEGGSQLAKDSGLVTLLHICTI